MKRNKKMCVCNYKLNSIDRKMSKKTMIQYINNNCKLVNTVSMNLIERIQANPSLIEGYFRSTDDIWHCGYPYALIFIGTKGCFVIPMIKQLEFLKEIKPQLF